MLSCIITREGNYKRLFEQFFERMSDLTRNHVETELCFDLRTRMVKNKRREEKRREEKRREEKRREEKRREEKRREEKRREEKRE